MVRKVCKVYAWNINCMKDEYKNVSKKEFWLTYFPYQLWRMHNPVADEET